MGARGKEEGKGLIFLPVSVTRDTSLEESNKKSGQKGVSLKKIGTTGE